MEDKLMDYNETVRYVAKNGWVEFIKLFQDEYLRHDLYSVSTEWSNSKQYICKFKGMSGDLIIGWK